MTREALWPASFRLSRRNTIPWGVLVESNNPIEQTDSFQMGDADPDTFDTILIRVFRAAIIELEYVLATTEDTAT